MASPRTEKEVRQAFTAALSHYPRIQLWSNPSGTAKFQGRFISYGLAKGASDLIGFVQKGRGGDAVFAAIELKANARSRYREGQEEFLELVRGAGGIALTVHGGNLEESVRMLAAAAKHRFVSRSVAGMQGI